MPWLLQACCLPPITKGACYCHSLIFTMACHELAFCLRLVSSLSSLVLRRWWHVHISCIIFPFFCMVWHGYRKFLNSYNKPRTCIYTYTHTYIRTPPGFLHIIRICTQYLPSSLASIPPFTSMHWLPLLYPLCSPILLSTFRPASSYSFGSMWKRRQIVRFCLSPRIYSSYTPDLGRHWPSPLLTPLFPNLPPAFFSF